MRSKSISLTTLLAAGAAAVAIVAAPIAAAAPTGTTNPGPVQTASVLSPGYRVRNTRQCSDQRLPSRG